MYSTISSLDLLETFNTVTALNPEVLKVLDGGRLLRGSFLWFGIVI